MPRPLKFKLELEEETAAKRLLEEAAIEEAFLFPAEAEAAKSAKAAREPDLNVSWLARQDFESARRILK